MRGSYDSRHSSSRRGSSRRRSRSRSHNHTRRGSSYMRRGTSRGRVYVGNLPNYAEKKTIEDLFGKFGSILEISMKRTISGTPFAFIEFEDPRDAQDAIQERDGYKIDGCFLRVEVPFVARSGRRGYRGNARRSVHRVLVRGLPPSGSWQDLKDHMREAGNCVFADVYRDGTGIVEFSRPDDMEYAIRQFNDSKFRSHEGDTSYISVSRLDDSGSRYSRSSRSRHYSPYKRRRYSDDDYHRRSRSVSRRSSVSVRKRRDRSYSR